MRLINHLKVAAVFLPVLGLFFVTTVYLVPWLIVALPRLPSAFESECQRVQPGMSVAEVERILGAGVPVPAAEVPHHYDGPVVNGDTIYAWEREHERFMVGIRDGVVCSKWFWSPSL